MSAALAASLAKADARRNYRRRAPESLPAVAWTQTPTVTQLIDATIAQYSLTWCANPSIAKWRGRQWIMFDGNDMGGETEAAFGQKCFLISSTDNGATWSAPVRPFTDASQTDNPIVSTGVHFQPNLCVVNDELWCFWTGDNGFVSKLTSPTGKWTTYRMDFRTADYNAPALVLPAEGPAANFFSKKATLLGYTDMFPFFPSQPTVLSDGTVAVPMTFQTDTFDPVTNVAAVPFFRRIKRTVILYVNPTGSTFTLSSPVPIGPDETESTPWEPFVVEDIDGKIGVFSRRNSQLQADSVVLQYASSKDRLTFTPTVSTGVEVPIARGQATRLSTGRWAMVHDDLPQDDLTDDLQLNGRHRRNPTVFLSRNGRDFIPGPSFSPTFRSVHYPQFMLEGSDVWVAYTEDIGFRRSLMLARMTAPSNEKVAYLSARRDALFLTVAGPALDTTQAPAAWDFRYNEQALSASAFTTAADLAFAVWMNPRDPDDHVVLDTRTAVATNGVLLRVDAFAIGSVNLAHGIRLAPGVPVFYGITVNATSGRTRTFYGAGGAALTTVDQYARNFLISGTPTDGQTIVVDGTTFTWRTAATLATEVTIGAAVSACAANLAAELVTAGFLAGARDSGHVVVARADYATFTISSAATGVTAPILALGLGAKASIGRKSFETSTATGLNALVYDARVFDADLTDAQVKGLYNALGAGFGYPALSGSAAAPAAQVALTPASTTVQFPGIDILHPTARFTSDGQIIPQVLETAGEASGSLELPWSRTAVSLRWRIASTLSAGRYVIASFGTRANPVRLYIDPADTTALKLNGTTVATITDASKYSVTEIMVGPTSVTVGSTSVALFAPRMFLGNAFGEGLLVPNRLVYFDVAAIRLLEVRDAIGESRTPLAHKASHSPDGSDALTDYVAVGEALRSRLKVGLYYTPPYAGNFSAATITSNVMHAVPFAVPRACTLDRIGIYVTGAGQAGATIRLGIYADDGTGYPGALILDAGTVLADVATTAREITISQALSRGLVWLVAVAQNAATTQPTVPYSSRNSPSIGAATLSDAVQGFSRSYAQTNVSGALPATFSTTVVNGNRDVLLAVRASA